MVVGSGSPESDYSRMSSADPQFDYLYPQFDRLDPQFDHLDPSFGHLDPQFDHLDPQHCCIVVFIA